MDGTARRNRWVIDRLIVENFKSYKGKHVIGPFSDFSCIVGPNGSGKSNAMDAVCFALGVDKKEMRVKSAAGIVFEVRGETPPAKASAELLFKSKDGKQEKSFKAVVTRSSGEIKYSVSDKHLPKRKYLEELADLNIHVTPDWTNFLVFQGQVEEIAMKTPKQLTEMIEQVSGSRMLKEEYDTLKKEWQKSEEAVADASVAKRRAGVERGHLKQSQKEAEKYQSLISDLKEMQATAALAQLFFIESTIKKNRKALESAEVDVAEAVSELDSVEKSGKSKKKQLADAHKEVMLLMRQDRDKQHQLNVARRLADELGEGARGIRSTIAKTKDALVVAKKQNAQQGERVKSLRRDLKEQGLILSRLEEQWKADAAKASGVSEADQKEYAELRRRSDGETLLKMHDLKTAQRGVERVRQEVETVERKERDIAARIRTFEESLQDITTRTDDVSGRGDNLNQELAAAQAERKKGLDMLATLRSQEEQQEKELHGLASSLTAIRSDREESRGDERKRKATEELVKLYPGVKGVLCDLVTVPDKRYKTAAAVAMGKDLDAVVVDTSECAHHCVDYLRAQRSVTLNFIPLADCRGKEVSDGLRSICEGSCKALADCLVYPPWLAPAIRYAVGDTLVTDTRAEGEKYAWKHRSGRHKVVCVDGTLMMKNGVMTGGEQSGARRAMRFDDKQYEKLKEKRDKLLTERTLARQDISKLEQREGELASQIASFEGRTAATRRDATEWEKKKSSVEEQLNGLRKAHAACKPQIAELVSKRAKAEKEVVEREREIEKIEARVFGDFGKRVDIARIREHERNMMNMHKERQEKRAHQTDLVARLEAQLGFEEAKDDGKVEQLERVLKRLSEELQQKDEDTKKKGEYNTKAETEAEQGKKKLEAKQKALRKAEEDVSAHKVRVEDMLQVVQKQKKDCARLETVLGMLRQQRGQQYEKCQIDEIDIPLAKGHKGKGEDDKGPINMSESFASDSQGGPATKRGAKTTTSDVSKLAKQGLVTIDFRSLPQELKAAANKGEAGFNQEKGKLHREIEQVQDEIDRCHPNLKAAEKLSAVDSKLHKAEEEIADAVTERRKALSSFRRVEDKRTQRYNAALNVISGAVDPIYKLLTGALRDGQAAGQAFLQSTSQEEPFLHGTSYDVMPPKKRSRSMHELSGGEKTLAALALLFAIHRASPSPFYVLDEVDAALDKYNTEQVIAYVCRKKTDCQFLVTTHKDQFYSTSETLCGIHKVPSENGSGIKTLDLRPFPDDGDDDMPAPSETPRGGSRKRAHSSGGTAAAKRQRTPATTASSDTV
eukprot:TRINITY_DN884_c4_g1_i1.p1 TRINITY_DN884_c4_g1~~TRINITY_DN884_c4_g1_i1.p1  ORF type:complete len:1317 (+),score=516.71 TRINITY_DN884_c4_g1_i1:66-3953(+)